MGISRGYIGHGVQDPKGPKGVRDASKSKDGALHEIALESLP